LLAEHGRVRIKVRPKHAAVYVDGAYAGEVNDFDGRNQGLYLRSGRYVIEVRLDGYHTISKILHISPGRRFELEARMEAATERDAASQ